MKRHSEYCVLTRNYQMVAKGPAKSVIAERTRLRRNGENPKLYVLVFKTDLHKG